MAHGQEEADIFQDVQEFQKWNTMQFDTQMNLIDYVRSCNPIMTIISIRKSDAL